VGVVGVISPWNYPLQLALTPVIGALAAGNRVLLKPSELTPATSALLRQLISNYFREDELAVVLGDATVGQAFSALPWDHLFFTGSTAVGRAVAQAAAANLTPVTLELGGKSPALFDDDADLALVAVATRRRQAAQCRTDVHCARLRNGAGSARDRARRRDPRCRGQALSVAGRKSRLHGNRQ
jgi:acyl-CoA reductase-like NAD-dependent aldehyde dehydrogenase